MRRLPGLLVLAACLGLLVVLAWASVLLARLSLVIDQIAR